jgi:hypothetical protein
MKEKIKRLIRQMSTWPIIGRLIHLGVVIIRLPNLWSQFMDLNRRQQMFETQQLPNLLEQLTDLNRRVVSGANQDRDNLVSSVPGALREMARDLADLRLRLDGLTQDTQQVAATSAVSPTFSNDAGVSRVLNTGKLEALRPLGPKLWFGDVLQAHENYLTVDRQSAPGVDIVGDAQDLPFELGQVHEIRMSNWLQRYTHEQLRDDVLPRLVSLLKPGGVFRAKVADSRAAMHAFLDGDMSAEQLRRVIFGNQVTPADSHLTILTAESLSDLLTGAGLREVRIQEAQVRAPALAPKAGATSEQLLSQAQTGQDRFEFEIVACK